jgi:hypothetical protein
LLVCAQEIVAPDHSEEYDERDLKPGGLRMISSRRDEMKEKTEGQPAETGTPSTRFAPELVNSAHGKPTVFIKGIWMSGDRQQNQQDGEPTRQAGDDLQTTAQPS